MMGTDVGCVVARRPVICVALLVRKKEGMRPWFVFVAGVTKDAQELKKDEALAKLL